MRHVSPMHPVHSEAVYNQFTLGSLNYVKTDLNVAFGQGAKFMDGSFAVAVACTATGVGFSFTGSWSVQQLARQSKSLLYSVVRSTRDRE